MHNYIVAAIGEWNQELFKEKIKSLPDNWSFASSPDELNILLGTLQPRYIFFPHWRWIVPKKILDVYECVCFHMTDVPYGRGGSPLQNLILRGHKDTVLTALRMEKSVDSGPVYFKKKLSLDGTAHQIYQRASLLAWEMIEDLIKNEPKAIKQVGEALVFKRRKPEESKIPSGLELEQIYDYIRMLDAPGYPKAFLSLEGYRIEFDQADLNEICVTARVRITKEDN